MGSFRLRLSFGPAKQQVGQSYWTQGSVAPLGSIDGAARRRVFFEEFADFEDEAVERARALRFLALSNLPNLLFCRPFAESPLAVLTEEQRSVELA
jgi:hypothetical protein